MLQIVLWAHGILHSSCQFSDALMRRGQCHAFSRLRKALSIILALMLFPPTHFPQSIRPSEITSLCSTQDVNASRTSFLPPFSCVLFQALSLDAQQGIAVRGVKRANELHERHCILHLSTSTLRQLICIGDSASWTYAHALRAIPWLSLNVQG